MAILFSYFLPLTSLLTRPSFPATFWELLGGGSSSSVFVACMLLWLASRGIVERWSSKRPDWNLTMREKKSSSGTVGAEWVRAPSLGRQLRWSSIRDP